MLNKQPIFVNGFQRGGTNILMNLIASHPDICMLGGETQVVFYGRNREPIKKWIPRLISLPILIGARQHLFWPYRFEKRGRIPRLLLPYIDFLLYASKMFAPRNRIKEDGIRNSIIEIHASRLLCKNVNGVSMSTPIFAEIYPDATFFGLIRNGLAVCEGFIRRGWTAKQIGNMYQIVSQQMIDDANKLGSYKIVYFEDLIQKPTDTIRELYEFAGLEIDRVSKFRLQAKKVMSKDGNRNYTFGTGQDRETNWFELEKLEGYFRKDVNDNQIARLDPQDRHIFLEYAGESMKQFGYI